MTTQEGKGSLGAQGEWATTNEERATQPDGLYQPRHLSGTQSPFTPMGCAYSAQQPDKKYPRGGKACLVNIYTLFILVIII